MTDFGILVSLHILLTADWYAVWFYVNFISKALIVIILFKLDCSKELI